MHTLIPSVRLSMRCRITAKTVRDRLIVTMGSLGYSGDQFPTPYDHSTIFQVIHRYNINRWKHWETLYSSCELFSWCCSWAGTLVTSACRSINNPMIFSVSCLFVVDGDSSRRIYLENDSNTCQSHTHWSKHHGTHWSKYQPMDATTCVV